jgi:hypothetical protein
MVPEGHHLCQAGYESLLLEIVIAISFGAVFVVIDQSDTSDVLGKLRAQWQATQLDSIPCKIDVIHASLFCTSTSLEIQLVLYCFLCIYPPYKHHDCIIIFA